ncbi:uncharacterized protein A1O9_11991 [Exophiala aquamarina CBS 119918]|uniref:Aminotransferase class I/classII large domain-containing protein n=1 Tax=Exophiala aquamarina CBS 119918 TaxID=1182545 RepID=A0A072NWK2_9EURO|nr:uncharacterized protein A1O9_11991 [Exophiala aquamarina CBS 119918]KEF52001.1 hypothetical protein A1O9_11991 [Exophiala aquamarina CBS 119918]
MAPSHLEQRLSRLLEKRKGQSRLRTLKSTPAGSVDFSSNDFLSLSTNNEYKTDYLALLNDQVGPLGSTGSRLLDGNSVFAEALEKEIAVFHGAENGLLTNSGFDANVSIFGFLPSAEDVILYDELIHASVHDGMRQSKCKIQVSFRHNDVSHMAEILGQFSNGPQAAVFLAVESVYSMDGDVAPLAEIVNVIDEICPQRNVYLIVDEAHATGCYGPNGSGRVCELGLENRVPIRLHTFGKALGASGAIILCSDVIRSYLINYARPLIYTTFMSYPSLVGIKNAYVWLQTGKTNILAANLYLLIDHLFTRLQSLSELLKTVRISPTVPLMTLPETCPSSPIFAILTRKPRTLAAHCQSAGFIARPVVAPTVPKGTERVRVCLHAGNTIHQIDRFVECVKTWIVSEGAAQRQQAITGQGQLQINKRLIPKI